ncbi:peptidyl-prolyl cis-trans isomerase [Actinophytocola gossypii]|uniref:PpiC domain-containing protein n=1 Tax=Actinophytocola gossypii TaxID=2812003 RepID=A0ABT2J3J0_9PSEU|nr:peptidyl-prolyl cis-trans isomerase [Actinophytocola gossypii]MCT2582085.1 hypothetical protein [Actinophytocola gossypii]
MRRGLLAGVLAAVAALVVTGVVLVQPSGDIATVDGHAVTRDELLFHMERLAPTVRNELRDAGDTFDWNQRAGDTTALRVLADRALEEIRRDKTLLVLARDQGLVDSVDHTAFLDELADENDARAEAVAAGKTVYGVTEFSPEEFYTKRLAELATSLKDRLSANPGDPLHVTDAEVRHEFDTNRADWSANATTYTYSTLVVPVPEGASPDYASALRRRVAAADRLADVAPGEPGARITSGTYGGSGSTGRNAHDQQLTAVLGNLAPGEVSDPVAGADHITYYQLDGKTVDEDAAFAGYAKRIRISLVDEKFSQLLQRRVDDGEFEVDTAALDAIDEEDVRL